VAVGCEASGLDDLAVGLSMEQSRLHDEAGDVIPLVGDSGVRIEREIQGRMRIGTGATDSAPLVEIAG
jgi:hypothetical protein